jgi:hypothetical protein
MKFLSTYGLGKQGFSTIGWQHIVGIMITSQQMEGRIIVKYLT